MPGGWKNGWNTFVRVSLRLESRSRKALEKQSLPRLVRFQLVFFFVCFFSNKRLYDIHVTWFDWFLCRDGDSARIKINYHSCFHNSWPNSKTNLKLKHLWEQGSPWCSGGPAQPAYSAYREDRLCFSVTWSFRSHSDMQIYSAQETFLKTVVLLNIFVETVIIFFSFHFSFFSNHL